MAREDSPYIVGDYWLDKRRDGKSTAWQITWYNPKDRSVRYRSTRTERLEEAKPQLDAHFDASRAKGRQSPDDAHLIPLFFLYWEEHGRKTVSPAQIASSLRAFMGFLMQDEVGMSAVVNDLTPALVERFREWRMGAHEYDVPWGGKDYKHSSPGVNGETVQRNLDDVRSAVHHAENNRRLDYAPKVPQVPKRYRSQPRERVLSAEELAAIAWYAAQFPDLGRYVALQIATAVRPEAAAAFDPNRQYNGGRLVDLHPPGWERTEKRNPIVPAIRALRLILRRWQGEAEFIPVKSRTRSWRTMRRALGLPSDVNAKTIRHTISTLLYQDLTVPERQISDLCGHPHPKDMSRTTRVYAKYDPNFMRETERALTRIWLRTSREARKFGAAHVLSTANGRGAHKVTTLDT